MVKLPVEFSSEASATNDFEKSWSITSSGSKTICSIPTEFGGMGGGFSPEDLFMQALMNCFIATFKVYSKASKVSFSSVSVKGLLIVDHDSSSKVTMKKAILEINLFGVDRPDRIETLVAKVFKDGFILNSVKTEIQHTLKIFDSKTEKTV